jgi:hypothetical protein
MTEITEHTRNTHVKDEVASERSKRNASMELVQVTFTLMALNLIYATNMDVYIKVGPVLLMCYIKLTSVIYLQYSYFNTKLSNTLPE